MPKLKFLSLLFIISILQIAAQNKDNYIKLKVFEIKKTSIRAIEVINDSTVWFAGANGKFGRITNSEIEIDSIIDNGKALNFRSIACNGQNIFILSIENPAIVFKINPNIEKIGNPEIVYQENHEKVFYDSMTFFDEQNGIAMGDPTEDCLSIILTNDGGQSWNKINCQDLPKSFEGEAAFAASDSNIAVFKENVWIVTGGKKARVFISNNLGKNWKAYDTPIVQGKTMTGIFSVDFYNEKNGIIMGGDWENKSNTVATKALTNDGGKTWQLIDNKMIPGYISCVKYIPNTMGEKIMAVSTEGVYQSDDSGHTWKKISDASYYSINFVNKNTAWLSGHEKIAKLSLN